MGEPTKDFKLRETYPETLVGAVLDLVARGCWACHAEHRPKNAFFLRSFRSGLFPTPSIICDGFVALCAEFKTPKCADRAVAAYNSNTNYEPEFGEALRFTRPTPTTLELVVPQPDHRICTRALVTNGRMWYGAEIGGPPVKAHPLMSLLAHCNDNMTNAGLKEVSYLGRIMDSPEHSDIISGSTVPTWEIQEIPITKCGQRWNPTGKSCRAGGWLIPSKCQYINYLDEPEKSIRPHDCPANGSVMMLSPELAGLEMVTNGQLRWGLRPQDIAFLRRNGIHGIPIWGCPRQTDITITHVQTRSTSLFGMAVQAVAAAQQEENKGVDASQLPRHVQAAVSKASGGGWVRYDRCTDMSTRVMPLDYVVELDD